jgi:hypothetical protein
MAPAASITLVCPTRAAHGALVVREVQLTPAAQMVGRPMTNAKAHVSVRPSRLSYKYRRSPLYTGRARKLESSHKMSARACGWMCVCVCVCVSSYPLSPLELLCVPP